MFFIIFLNIQAGPDYGVLKMSSAPLSASESRGYFIISSIVIGVGEGSDANRIISETLFSCTLAKMVPFICLH